MKRIQTIKENVESETQTAEEASQEGVCPECGGDIRKEQREFICQDCGLIIDEDQIDHGPDWRAFTHKEKQEKRRTGSPMTNTRHDKGLSTNIGWGSKDINGNTISQKKQRKIKRMRKMDKRSKASDSQDRGLRYALGELDRLCSELDIPDDVQEIAATTYRRIVNEDMLQGRTIESMVGASLHTALRMEGIPRSLADIEQVSHVSKKDIARDFRYISEELGLKIQPPKSVRRVSGIGGDLDLNQVHISVVEELLEWNRAKGRNSGKHPGGLVGGAIYFVGSFFHPISVSFDVTQDEIAEAANVTSVTVRDQYHRFEEQIEGDEDIINRIEEKYDQRFIANDDSWEDIQNEEVTLEGEKKVKDIGSVRVEYTESECIVYADENASQTDVSLDFVAFLDEEFDLFSKVLFPVSMPRRGSNYFIISDLSQGKEQSSTWRQVRDNDVWIDTKVSKEQKTQYLGYLALQIDLQMKILW